MNKGVVIPLFTAFLFSVSFVCCNDKCKSSITKGATLQTADTVYVKPLKTLQRADTVWYEPEGYAGMVGFVISPVTVCLQDTDIIDIIMWNNTPETIMTGNRYNIDMWNGERWKRVDLSRTKDGILMATDALGVVLEPGDEVKRTFKLWHKQVYDYTSGKYRITLYFGMKGQVYEERQASIWFNVQ